MQNLVAQNLVANAETSLFQEIVNWLEPHFLSRVCPLADNAGESSMTVEDFQRFAAECEAMADGTRNQKDKEVWIRLAERWLKCATLAERDESDQRARHGGDLGSIH